MTEYTDLQDNSEEITKCMVSCETDDSLLADEKKPPQGNVVTKEEYIDEP